MTSDTRFFNHISIKPAFESLSDGLDVEDQLPQSEMGMQPSDYCNVLVDSVVLGEDAHGGQVCIYNFDAGTHEICCSKRWHVFAHAWQMGDFVIWTPASDSLLRLGQFLQFNRQQYEKVLQGSTLQLPKITEDDVFNRLAPPRLDYLDPGQQKLAYDAHFYELHEIYERALKDGGLQAWSPSTFRTVLWASHGNTEVLVVNRETDMGFATFGHRTWQFERRIEGTAVVLTNKSTSQELSTYLQCVFESGLPSDRIGRQWLI